MKQLTRSLQVAGWVLLSSWTVVPLASAQIVTDNTLPVSSIVPPSCQNCTITGGTERGVNLFHSFREFSIPTGGQAWFNNSLQIQNILTRITGSSISNIDGLIKANGTANLFLLNPNGIVFGQNARLQIGGSFFASTANSFKFADGSEFSATNPQAPPLLTVNVTPGLQTGQISPGSTITNRGNLITGQDLVLESTGLNLQGQLIAGRNLILKAQDTLRARDSTSLPLIVRASNNLLVQGDRVVDIVALKHPQSGFFSGRNLVLRSASTVSGDAHFHSGGNFRIEQLDGSPGNLSSPQDPIIFAAGDVVLGDYVGNSLHILAGGSVTLGNVEIIDVDPTNSLFETIRLSDGTDVDIDGASTPALDVRAGVDWSQLGGFPGSVNSDGLGATFAANATSADITIGNITNFTGTVFLTNQYAPNRSLSSPNGIQTGRIDVSNLDSDNNLIDADAGTVVVDTRSNLSLTGNTIFANTFVDGRDAGNVRLLAAGAVVLNDAVITTNVDDGVAGNGGDIIIKAGSLAAVNGSVLRSDTLGFGNAGSITVQARDTVSLSGQDVDGNSSGFFSRVGNSNNFAEGNSGNISITARSVVMRDEASLDTSIFYGNGTNGEPAIAGAIQITAADTVLLDHSRIFSNVDTGSLGVGGDITITSGSVSLTNGSNLFSFLRAEDESVPGAVGEAGNITINAQGLVSFDGVGSDGTFTSAESNVGVGAVGNAGKITVNAGALSLTNGAELSSSTFGIGNAGDITIQTQGEVRVDGSGDNGVSLIESQVGSGAEGSAGKIDITADSLTLKNGGQILTLTRGLGNAGEIKLMVRNRLTLDGVSTGGSPSAIVSDVESGARGNSSGISINTGSLFISGGAELTASTSGIGNAGSIFITARDQVSITGDGSAKPSEIPEGVVPNSINSSADRGSSGNSGSIRIDSPRLLVRQGARILVSNLEEGQAGNITINTQAPILDQGYIQATTSSGNGGNITLNVRDILLLRHGSLISATAGTESAGGDGGNVTIRSAFVIGVLNENSDITANAFTGIGGNITINANQVFGLRPQPQNTRFSDITASSQLGISGTIILNTLNFDPTRGLEELNSTPVDPSRLVVQGCNSGRRIAKGQSRFVVLGRGGLSASPDDWFGGTPILDDLGSSTTNSIGSVSAPASAAIPESIVEAQEWIRGNDGEIYLVRQPSNTPLQAGKRSPVQCQSL